MRLPFKKKTSNKEFIFPPEKKWDLAKYKYSKYEACGVFLGFNSGIKDLGYDGTKFNR